MFDLAPIDTPRTRPESPKFSRAETLDREHRGSLRRSGERENSLCPGEDVVGQLGRGAGQHRFGLGAEGG
jgi:hypothetical protein